MFNECTNGIELAYICRCSIKVCRNNLRDWAQGGTLGNGQIRHHILDNDWRKKLRRDPLLISKGKGNGSRIVLSDFQASIHVI